MSEEIIEIADIDGVGPTTLAKLSAAGIVTLMSLAVSTPSAVAELAGMTGASARKIIQKARDSLKLGLEQASEYSKKYAKNIKLATGCTTFDTIIGGGFESGAITELYGTAASGKSTLCHYAVVKALSENKDTKCIYLDTEKCFRVERIQDFCEGLKVELDDALERIYIARAFNFDHQMLLTDEIEKVLQKDKSYRVLIIDSLVSQIRAEYQGRGMLADRQQKLNKYVHQLMRMADIYNLVVIVTNQIISDPSAMFGDPNKPAGGNVVAHMSTTRIYLRQGKAGSTFFKLVDSQYLPPGDGNFMIVKEGIKDV